MILAKDGPFNALTALPHFKVKVGGPTSHGHEMEGSTEHVHGACTTDFGKRWAGASIDLAVRGGNPTSHGWAVASIDKPQLSFIWW